METMQYIIYGRLNTETSNNCYYWKIPDEMVNEVKIGSYALVPNKNDYDLVKIIGVYQTLDKYLKHIAPNGKLKEVIKIIPRHKIRKD